MRIGILGGTFNPIHYGHLRSAGEVRAALSLDALRFVPSASPPHKPQDEVAPAADRLEMVRLALEDYPAYSCDSTEVRRGGTSYTLDTVEEMSKRLPDGGELFFIIGADAFAELGTWHRPREVLGAVHFAVTLRGEQNAPAYFRMLLRVVRAIEPDYRVREDAPGKEMRLAGKSRVIRFLPITEVDISATRVRQRVREAASLRHLLPRQVELFIIRRRLYGHSGVVPAD